MRDQGAQIPVRMGLRWFRKLESEVLDQSDRVHAMFPVQISSNPPADQGGSHRESSFEDSPAPNLKSSATFLDSI